MRRSETGAVTPGTLGTFFLQSSQSGLLLLVNLLFARVLGVDGFGQYTYALAWTGVLLVPALFGQTALVTREIAASRVRREWSRLVGLLHWSRTAVLTASAVLWAGLSGAAVLLAEPPLSRVFLVVAATIPIVSLTTVHAAALRGLGHVLLGQVPEALVRPLSLLVLLGLVALPCGLDSVGAGAFHLIACVAASIAAFALCRRALPGEAKAAAPGGGNAGWFAASLPFVLLTGLRAVNIRTDTLMLGAIDGTESAGVYFAASRLAAFGGFALGVVSIPLAPRVASLHAAGDRSGLQLTVTRSCRVVLAGTLPVLAVLVFGGPFLLRLFGNGFQVGQGALLALCAGQLVNAATGPVGLLLNQTGHERDTLFALCLSAAANVLLNAILIPTYGPLGAALATAASGSFWNLLLFVRVRQRLGVRCTPF